MKKGIYIPKGSKLGCLRPVLKKWISLNCLLASRWKEDPDAPWWYNERASVSVLAGAVWRAGDYAFEEYANEKKREDKPRAGRQDLEFSIKRSERGFKAEAKQCWLPATKVKSHIRRISASLESAKKEIRRCPSWGMRKVAIVFGVPYVAKSHRSQLSIHIDRLIDQAVDIDAGAVAWVFPDLRRQPISDGGYIHPGVVIWIKEVGR